MHDLKPALSYHEQIEKLKTAHGLTIEDDEEALEILKLVTYYRLKGYGIGLQQKEDPEKYCDGISLRHIYMLHEFDSNLRNLIIHVTEQIEIQLRAQISNHIALTYGEEGYMNTGFFTDKRSKEGALIHSEVIQKFKKECENQKNVPFVKHHNEKYDGHFPVWVAVELFSFGNLSSLYSIMKPIDQKSIADLYNTEPKHLGSWILSLVEIRNICAHGSRLYNMPLKQSPYLYMEHKKYRSKNINKLFPVILTLKRMLNNDTRWTAFVNRLKLLLSDYQDVVRLSFLGFPRDWQKVLSE